MVDKSFLGHLCTAMMFNELEIIAWCYTIYLLLTYDPIGRELGKDSILKFRHPDELVLASAIFAKVRQI